MALTSVRGVARLRVLAAIVIGSGIMAPAVILTFGPVFSAHFDPVV